MQTTRALAEYRINVPDLGATSHLQGRAGARGDVTATQVNAIVGQTQLTDDMRARVFRLDLGRPVQYVLVAVQAVRQPEPDLCTV